MLQWARDRSGKTDDAFAEKFKKWPEWMATPNPELTYPQLKTFAKFAHVPFGYLFLEEPPREQLPIPDFRAGRGHASTFSVDLLDTIHLNQMRQTWYEDYLSEFDDDDHLSFPGSARQLTPAAAAKRLIDELHYSVAERQQLRTRAEARKYLIETFEGLGGLVVTNSVVGNNNHRPLDIEEFRGFTLHSSRAPLVFINSRDTLNGQIFSLLHEFAHVWRGESGVSAGGTPLERRLHPHEVWCDDVAAEVLVPASDLKAHVATLATANTPLARLGTGELDALADRYLCSTLVVLIRLKDLGYLPRKNFDAIYDAEVARLIELAPPERPSGGNFYATQRLRIGDTLSRAIIADTQSLRTPMTHALDLLGIKSTETFDKYAQYLGEG